MVEKVIATPAALELIAVLKARHGPGLMFHQSGGCCDNSAANCYLLGEITTGAGDVYLGNIGGCPFYIGKAQYAYWQHTQLIIDVIEGHGGTFSLEGPEGKAFHTRSRVFNDEEMQALGLSGAGVVQAGVVQAGAVQAGAVQAGGVQRGAVPAGGVHGGQ